MSCVYVTFSCGALDPVRCLVVSIPDLCLLPYLKIVDSLVSFTPDKYILDFTLG